MFNKLNNPCVMRHYHLLFRLFALVAALSCALGASADTENYYSGGVYYNLYDDYYGENFAENGDCYAEVSGGPTSFRYSGSVTISSSVYYNGKTYPVKAIGNNAFSGCTGLTSLTIPASVRVIRLEAFNGCTNLTSVTCMSTTPPVFSDPDSEFDDILNPFSDITYTKATLFVPRGCKSAYQAADWWKRFTNIQELNYDFVYNGLYYRIDLIDAKTVRVTYPPGGAKYSGNVTIPSSVPFNGQNYAVECIDLDAFAGCTNLTSVTLPSTMEVICSGAFRACSSLTSITLPNSVDAIGDELFHSCTKLSSVTLSTALHTITNSMFENCTSLTNVTIPDNVTTIGSRAFYLCSKMTSVTIPNEVSSIGGYAFAGCPLTSVTSLANNPPTLANAGVFDSNVYNTAWLTVPRGCRDAYMSAYYWKNFSHINANIGDTFVVNGIYYQVTSGNTVEVTFKDSNYNSYSGSVYIPSSVTNGGKTYSVTGIGWNAFYICQNLTSVTLPSTLTYIYSWAFYGCTSLMSINIPNSVTRIEDKAFYYCTSLTSVNIPSSLVYIGQNAFENCYALTRVNITDVASWCRIEMKDNPLWYAHHLYMNGSEVTNLTIPSSVTTLNDLVFAYCYGLKSVTIGNSVTSIGQAAFYQCFALTSVDIPSSVTTIGQQAFYGDTCLTNVTIPNSLTKLDKWVFCYCYNLTSVVIPNSVTAIDQAAFGGCIRLRDVTIGNSVSTIGEYAFAQCSALTSVTCLAITPPTMAASNVFDDATYSSATLKVPRDRMYYYRNANWWKNFSSIVANVQPGDVDGDGQVGISDVADLIDLILSGTATIESCPAADVDGDGRISIADVSELIDILLGN